MRYRLNHGVVLAAVAAVLLNPVDALAQMPGHVCTTLFRFCDDCDTFLTFSVQKGKVCTVRYAITQIGGPGAMAAHERNETGIGAILGQRVVVRPRGGIYGTANETFGAYRANDGFVGNDSFQVDIEYEKRGRRFVTHLKANVNVHP